MKGRSILIQPDPVQSIYASKTILGLVKSGETLLQSYKIGNDPRLEAEILLSALLKGSRLDLYLKNDQPVDPSLAGQFHSMLDRRGNHEPLQYITGKQLFLNRTFSVGPKVLIPRPETEGLVLEALHFLKEGPFLDLGTGSGCIAISLLLEDQKCREGYAVDVSAEALSFAGKNAETLGVSSSLRLFEGDLFAPLPGVLKSSFEVVVSNPPYLDMELDDIEPSVRHFEPKQALDGGPGGLKYYERIFGEVGQWLKKGGHLILEIGYGQKARLLELLEKFPLLTLLRVTPDEQGIDRVVTIAYDEKSFLLLREKGFSGL